MRPVTFYRDPESVFFDAQARVVIGLAITQYERRLGNVRLTPHVRVHVPNPHLPTGPRERRPSRLSPTERAFTRALYWDSRIHQLGRDKPDSRWSLKLSWGDVPLLPGQARQVRVMVFPDTDGARYMLAHPETSWVEHPELRAEVTSR